jgi:2-methylfumaryl-CoA isomerase
VKQVKQSQMAAIGILAAERRRLRSGQGADVKLALSDVAPAVTDALGRLTQAKLGDPVLPDGNYLYGVFGHDFAIRDGRQVMVVGLTGRQWAALKQAIGLDAAKLGAGTGLDLDDEGGRYAARDAIMAALAPWFAVRHWTRSQGSSQEQGSAGHRTEPSARCLKKTRAPLWPIRWSRGWISLASEASSARQVRLTVPA